MINPQYEGSWQQAREVLEENGFVLLANILDDKTHQELLQEVAQRSYEEEYEPALHRYEQAIVPEQAHELLEYVAEQLNTQPPTRTQLHRYSRGSYTLQDDDEEEDTTTYTLFLTQEWDTNWRGEHTYAKQDQQPLRVPPQTNTLLVTKKDLQTRFFVKRVNHHAKNNTYYAIRGR